MVAAVIIGAAVPGAFLVRYLVEPRPPLPPDLPDAPCPLDRDAGAVRHPSDYTDRAAPYAGPGPHPADLFRLGDGDTAPLPVSADFRLPSEWRPTGGRASTDVQLVVCEYLTGTGAVIQTCQYPAAGAAISLVRASYAYHVYEARTGKLVAEFALDSSPGALCPHSILYQPGQPPPREFPGEVNSGALHDELRPIVEDTVRIETP